MLGKLFADVALPKWVAAAGAGILGALLPTEAQQTAAVGAASLVILDTITGVVASKYSGKPITSAKMGRVLVKFLAYGSVIAVAGIAGQSIPGGQSVHGATVTAVLTLIIATEGVSVLENARAMGAVLPLGLEQWLAGRIQKPDDKDEDK